jgi:hypothetical protein
LGKREKKDLKKTKAKRSIGKKGSDMIYTTLISLIIASISVNALSSYPSTLVLTPSSNISTESSLFYSILPYPPVSHASIPSDYFTPIVCVGSSHFSKIKSKIHVDFTTRDLQQRLTLCRGGGPSELYCNANLSDLTAHERNEKFVLLIPSDDMGCYAQEMQNSTIFSRIGVLNLKGAFGLMPMCLHPALGSSKAEDSSFVFEIDAFDSDLATFWASIGATVYFSHDILQSVWISWRFVKVVLSCIGFVSCVVSVLTMTLCVMRIIGHFSWEWQLLQTSAMKISVFQLLASFLSSKSFSVLKFS